MVCLRYGAYFSETESLTRRVAGDVFQIYYFPGTPLQNKGFCFTDFEPYASGNNEAAVTHRNKMQLIVAKCFVSQIMSKINSLFLLII